MKMQIDIKRALALASTFNFLHSCATSCLLPFLTLYFRQLGLTAAMTGVIMGTKHLISLVWRPVSNLLAHLYNKGRVVMTGSVVCSAALAMVLLAFPPADVHISSCNISDSTTSLTEIESDNMLTSNSGYTSSGTGTNILSSASSTSGELSLNQHVDERSDPQLPLRNLSVLANYSHTQPLTSTSTFVRSKRSKLKSKRDDGHLDFLGRLKVMDVQHQIFFLILITVSVWECAAAPLEWTADDSLYEYLDCADASDYYSSAAVWRLLGGACGVGGAGLLVSQLSCLIASRIPRSAVHFFCYAALAALALPVAIFLPHYLNKKRDKANWLFKGMQLVRGSSHALLCASTTLLVGFANSTVDNFLLWQMQDLGSSELHMGVSLAVALLSEAAFPLMASQVTRLLSPARLLAVAAVSLAAQCFYYSFLWGPWVVLPAQILSCFSSGAFWWAVQAQCDNVATPGTDRSVRRVYDSLHQDLGQVLGSFLGGFVVQRFGLVWLFRGVALVLMAWCVCLPLLQVKAPLHQRINYSRLLAADMSEDSDSGSEEQDWLDKAMQDDKSNKQLWEKAKPLSLQS
ncbi:major facilitator superfamily domain-containing protein 6-like [Aulostomus maculatus]